ncbi:hypothetical protein [Halomonas litopenaei]|uniref:hypothetical protein n=1 Tax=Halomonas litopenaei TaxID=2109328 RepID=UPI003F9FA38F
MKDGGEWKSFWGLVFSSVKSAVAGFSALASLGLGYLVHEAVKRDVIGPFLSSILICLVAFLCVISFLSARKAYDFAVDQRRYHVPRVLHGRKTPAVHPDAIALLVIEPTPIYAYDGFVSIYHVNDGIEEIVGVGKVINIQQDGKVQVLVIKDLGGYGYESVVNNNFDALKSLVIKSTVPAYIFEDAL